MATVDKNFRIKNGLVVEGTTGTINGNNILTESASDSYILNLVGGSTLVKSVNGTYFSVDGSGNLDFQYSDFKSALTTDGFALISDITNAISTFGSQSSTDISNAISTAESYTDSAISAEVTRANSAYDAAGSASNAATVARIYADSLAINYDAAGAASAAESAAKFYADDTIGAFANAANTYARGYADTKKTEAISVANTYTDGKVANLVGMAPSLLDTLEKIDAAIANDANFSTTLLNDIATAQATAESYTNSAISTEVTNRDSAIATAKSEAITAAENYADGLASNYDAAGAASAAQTAAQSYADGLAGNYDPAGAASTAESNANSYTDTAVGNIASAVSQIDGAAIAPESVTINSVAKQYATTITGAMISDGASTVMGLSASTYRTVKALVKAKNGVHTQVSEILLTLDTSNNVAITEYAMVGTNGSLGDVSAIYHASGNIFITFTPVYDNTDVMCYATALI